jgi:HlyD family secretion protein
MAKSRRSIWGKLLLVLPLALVGGGALWHVKGHGDEAPGYATEQVKRGDLTQVVTATGTLNPVVNVTVGSQISGRICKLYVDYNSTVKSNQVIAEIDPSTYQAALEQAQADLASAKANAELQRVEADRSTELFKDKLISRSDYDTALATLHEAEATVQIKEALLDMAKANLGYCKIVSPVKGVVISRAVELGQTVASSFNTPTLFQIANDLTKMQIDASVDEADIGVVKQGERVDFTVDAYPNRTFHGIVTQVRNAPTTVNNVVTYDTVIGVTNSDYSLKPGMTASVSIVISRHKQILEIPNAALRFEPADETTVQTNILATDDGQRPGRTHGKTIGKPADSESPGAWDERCPVYTVYLLREDATDKDLRLQAMQVTTGITDNIHTEVLSGLKEGDRIVTGIAVPALAHRQGMQNPFGVSRRF